MKISRLAAWCVVGLLGCGAADSSSEKDPTEVDDQELVSSRANVTTNPSPVIVGSPTLLDVRVKGAGNVPITQFDPLHTQPMHLIAVSSDLEDFIHVHPALQPAGNLTVSATFARNQPYKLFMEYDPAGAAGQTLSNARVAPAGSHIVSPQLSAASAFDGSVSKAVTATGTVVELAGTPGTTLKANVPAHLVVRFRNTNGTPVNNLTSWLGMPAHGIIVSPDLKTFVHAHGMPESTAGGGHGAHGTSTDTGPVGIDVTLPKAGLYKIWVQFQRATTVMTAPFVLNVVASDGPPPPPPPSCATMTCPHGQTCMVMGGAPMCM